MLIKSLAASLLLASASQIESVLAAPADRTPLDVTVDAIQNVQVLDEVVEVFANIRAARATTTTTKKPAAKKTTTSKKTTTTTKKATATNKGQAKKKASTTTTTTTKKRKTTTTTTTTTTKRKPTPKTTTTTTTTTRRTTTHAPTTTTIRSSTGTPRVANKTSSATTISATATSTASTPGKRGLAYNNASLTQPFGGSNSQVTWTYNWYLAPCEGFPWVTSCNHNPNLMHIPMLWGNNADLLSAWPSAVESALGNGTTHLMSFNEPDGCFTGSSCMTMTDAVSTYKKYMQPYAGRAKLGAPAVTNAGAPHGLTWLTQFMAQCDTCTFDFVNVHWYSNKYAGADYFKSFINATRQVAGGRPIWVTEFALTDENPFTEAENEAFLKEVMGWMDSQEDVAGYSYFMDKEGMLINANGNGKSSLGLVYDSYSNGTVKGGLMANATAS
ncbi:hypothetical protein C1H76_0893 [Elsinoe australis]|uniref:Asl1-like glycosyl hydrolase catalytic domain-containing protein n=1 Tax=Elsinoe australis TaxID=40998 RepID=A0A4U7B6V6_9PEZI|nr:hypothetical protein C1H76_0893 [Elsinoe australis]